SPALTAGLMAEYIFTNELDKDNLKDSYKIVSALETQLSPSIRLGTAVFYSSASAKEAEDRTHDNIAFTSFSLYGDVQMKPQLAIGAGLSYGKTGNQTGGSTGLEDSGPVPAELSLTKATAKISVGYKF